MTGIEIFTLLFLGVLVVVGVAHQLTKHHDVDQDIVQDAKSIEVEAEQVSQELYNKDLRPIVAKKAPKKEKVEEQVEAMRKVVDAHDTLVKEIAKVAPEVVKEEKPVKSEFPIDKPKKKRKYYPRKKK